MGATWMSMDRIPYQVMLSVDGTSMYTRTYVTTDSDQIGQIYLGEEELKFRRIGQDAMLEQDADARNRRKEDRSHRASGHRSGSECDADKDLGKNGLHEGRSNSRAIYVAGRTRITFLLMEGRDLWMSFLLIENLDDADQFILGRDFVGNLTC